MWTNNYKRAGRTPAAAPSPSQRFSTFSRHHSCKGQLRHESGCTCHSFAMLPDTVVTTFAKYTRSCELNYNTHAAAMIWIPLRSGVSIGNVNFVFMRPGMTSTPLNNLSCESMRKHSGRPFDPPLRFQSVQAAP